MENRVYYNENDPKAAAVLRELISKGHIAKGDVDERSIEDVCPDELRGYIQCHFFAGFGLWSLALRWAGWSDDQPVWTGSCPCQPFSAAGKGKGFADERHLWPAFFHLIQHGKGYDVPLYGEQVASKDGLAWLDLVQTDLEAEGYAVWPFDLCSAGFGAPIIRQRLFWVASPDGTGWGSGRVRDVCSPTGEGLEASKWSKLRRSSNQRSSTRIMGSSEVSESRSFDRKFKSYIQSQVEIRGSSVFSGVELSEGERFRKERNTGEQSSKRPSTPSADACDRRPGPTNGIWSLADWIRCRDNKWRPVEPGTFPLAHGYSERVGLLCGYGNAISPVVAAEFIVATKTEFQ